MKTKQSHRTHQPYTAKQGDSAACLPYLKRIPYEELPLQCRDPKALSRLLPYTRALHIPRGRTLIQPGQRCHGRMYLCGGQLSIVPAARTSARQTVTKQTSTGQTKSTATIVSADARHTAPLTLFFPGCRQARTLSTARVLYIEERAWTECNTSTELSPIPATHLSNVNEEPLETVETWLEAFLDSPMMRRLSKSHWQQLLRRFETRTYPPGTTIIQKHNRADCCYLIQSGNVIVHQDDAGQQIQARLSAADLFGTDALITGQLRNAWVTAEDLVTVARLSAASFRQHLLAGVAQSPPQDYTHIQQICIDECSRAAVIHVDVPRLREQILALPLGPHYQVCGGSQQQRMLCVFMMAVQGLSVTLKTTPQATLSGSISARSDEH
ncbi:MAG: cyclic nucleotide-binding domain-containing protein [Pseudomonadota bacterium]